MTNVRTTRKRVRITMFLCFIGVIALSVFRHFPAQIPATAADAKAFGEIERLKNCDASSLTELLALSQRRDMMLRVNDYEIA